MAQRETESVRRLKLFRFLIVRVSTASKTQVCFAKTEMFANESITMFVFKKRQEQNAAV